MSSPPFQREEVYLPLFFLSPFQLPCLALVYHDNGFLPAFSPIPYSIRLRLLDGTHLTSLPAFSMRTCPSLSFFLSSVLLRVASLPVTSLQKRQQQYCAAPVVCAQLLPLHHGNLLLPPSQKSTHFFYEAVSTCSFLSPSSPLGRYVSLIAISFGTLSQLRDGLVVRSAVCTLQ